MNDYTNSNHPTNRSKRNKISNKQEPPVVVFWQGHKPTAETLRRPATAACNKSKTYSNVQEKP